MTENTPSMPIDSDMALKGFDEANDSTLLFEHMMKLYLALDKTGIGNPYDEIDDEESVHLCSFPDRLMPHLKEFILWQRNVLKLDLEDILRTALPKGLNTKYEVKGIFLKSQESEDERKAIIRKYLDEQDAYFARFNEVRATLEAAEDRFTTIEGTMLRCESMDEGLIAKIQNEKKNIEDIRKQLCDMKAIMEDEALPDTIRFEEIYAGSKSLMHRLSYINIALRDNVRKHQIEIDGEST